MKALVLFWKSVIATADFSDVTDGILYVADAQTHGKGRTGDWVSPKGCLMFSYKFSCSIKEAIGINMIIPLAISSAVKRIAVKNKVDFSALSTLKIKWPNDVYLNNQKIAGILVNSNLYGKKVIMTIGIGINVSNSKPTLCLNDHFGKKFDSCNVLIEYLNAFDELYCKLVESPDELVQEYKENWLHL